MTNEQPKRKTRRIGLTPQTTTNDAIAMQKCAQAGLTQTEIAKQFGVHQSTVSKALNRLESTIDEAGMYARSKAADLAEKAIRNCDVDQALEILDRLQVDGLTKREKASGAPSVAIVVGSGAFYGLPALPAGE